MKRRDFTQALAALAGGFAMPVGRTVMAAVTEAGSADPAHSARLVVVFMRGAVDGLNVVIPHGDGEYYHARERIAVARPGAEHGAIDLDGYFGLHPALQAVLPLWKEQHLAFVHASGSPDTTRSHFDAQDYMESGTPGRKGTADGWMNRMLAQYPGPHPVTQAVNVGETVPRILAGTQVVASLPVGRAATRPAAIDRPAVRAAFDRMYSGDDALAKAYAEGVAAHAQLAAEMTGTEEEEANNGAPLPNGLADDAARLGRLMRRDASIRAGFVAVGGWDTHANEGAGTGQLANRLRPLGDGLTAFARELGPAFDNTVIVVMSEFGRTFKENGNGGTDHGHGNVIWLLGGPVHGGMYGDWPGLNHQSLYEGRDLAITTDFRDVLAVVLERHLRLGDNALQAIFPGQFARNRKLGGVIA